MAASEKRIAAKQRSHLTSAYSQSALSVQGVN
jgi:hypothetical protein